VCRLLGVIATESAPLSELFAGSIEPFLDLAREHADGWGISYVTPTGRVVVAKEATPAYQSSRFDLLVKRTVSTAAILHLRLASPQFAVTKANTHPFGDTRFSFAHNGHFGPARALDPMLGLDVASARGGTDSERYFLAIRRRIGAGASPAAAIADTAHDIRILAAEWTSLNCLVLTPRALLAYADHDPQSEVSRRRGPEFFDLRYRMETGRVMVASTGWAQPADSWHRLLRRHVLEVQRDLRIILHDG
jgi:predicted glutamine amidotransferase